MPSSKKRRQRMTFHSFGNTDHENHRKLNDVISENTAKSPPGFVEGKFGDDQNMNTQGNSGGSGEKAEDRRRLLVSQAWGTAQSPGRQIFMTGLMMYMSGNTISIFSLMMIFMGFFTPLKACFAVNSAFRRFEDPLNGPNALLLPKIVYLLLNLACVGIGLWKLNSLGLVPTPANIPPTLPVPNYTEFSAGIILQ